MPLRADAMLARATHICIAALLMLLPHSSVTSLMPRAAALFMLPLRHYLR